jgi:hypothetical protein
MTFIKKPKTAVPAIFAIALIALAIVGFSYAHWSETLWLNGKVTTGNMCAEFEKGMESQKDPYGPNNDWTCTDGFTDIHQIDKNIGHTNLTYVDTDQDGCNDAIKIDMGNVYPCYYEHIGFWIHNCGTIPWRLWRVTFNPGTVIIYANGYLTLDLNDDGHADIEIKWGNNFGDQVDPCHDFEVSFQIHILQPIPEGTTLTFSIAIEMVNWNEWPVPS